MTGRPGGIAPLVMTVLAVVLAVIVYAAVTSGLPMALDAPSATAASATSAARSAAPSARPPQVTIEQEMCCEQTARFLAARWKSTEPISAVDLELQPTPPFACRATLAPAGASGTFGCDGFLAGDTTYVARLQVTSAAGRFPVEHRFTTMGDRLKNVRWYTEFEDPTRDPLACAAASVRIVQAYTTGKDPMTAEQILAAGQALNRSRDPGLDPVAIAAIQKRLDARNNYHYYRFRTKEEATKAAVYWLIRSGKPVHMITLAGQHDPVLIGFVGAFGTFYDDPINRIDGVVVLDPQRGDLDPRTQGRRPDKYRSVEFQTGRLLGMPEWYGDEWWFGFPYAAVVDGIDIERNDGAYPRPHWAGTFTILVDDSDAEWPSDKEGRVRFR